MCGYSVESVRSRNAIEGETLRLVQGEHNTNWFASPEDLSQPVCIKSGSELSFTQNHRRAVFTQLQDMLDETLDIITFEGGKELNINQLTVGVEVVLLRIGPPREEFRVEIPFETRKPVRELVEA